MLGWLLAMHYSCTLRQSHENWIIGDNDGISDDHFPEIQTHNILIGVGSFYGLLHRLESMQCRLSIICCEIEPLKMCILHIGRNRMRNMIKCFILYESISIKYYLCCLKWIISIDFCTTQQQVTAKEACTK